MVVIRWLLARIILLVDFIFHPRGIKRDQKTQDEFDQATSKLALYQYAACPFCVKVRWAAQRNGLNIETRDAKRNDQYAKELVAGGGQLKVPCLKIQETDGTDTWLYESSDIISYLDQRFSLVVA
jgi:glutaredoxin